MNKKNNVIPENFLFGAQRRKKIYPGPSYAFSKTDLSEIVTGSRINLLRKFSGMTLLFCMLLAISPVFAADETDNGETGKSASGLPIPRFASLRTGDVNLRTGPGTRYPIEWVFTHQGMPVEITAEYEFWRRVRDSDGDEGWVHKNELSGKRGAIVTGAAHELRRDPDASAAVAAHLEAGAMGQLLSCSKDWCKLKFQGTKGWLSKSAFWGAYKEEVFD